jgi:hypothetical protein
MDVSCAERSDDQKIRQYDALSPTHAPRNPPRSYEMKSRFALAWQKSEEIG